MVVASFVFDRPFVRPTVRHSSKLEERRSCCLFFAILRLSRGGGGGCFYRPFPPIRRQWIRTLLSLSPPFLSNFVHCCLDLPVHGQTLLVVVVFAPFRNVQEEIKKERRVCLLHLQYTVPYLLYEKSLGAFIELQSYSKTKSIVHYSKRWA